MQLLVSDFDGTFHPRFFGNLKANIKAIKKLRDQGDKVMIATGRSFSAIKEELVKHQVPYDYLSCNDGAILFDDKDQLIKAFPIPEKVAKDLYQSILNGLIGDILEVYGAKDYMEFLPKEGIGVLEFTIVSPVLQSFNIRKRLFQLIETAEQSKNETADLTIMTFPGMNFVKSKDGKSRPISYLKEMLHLSPSEIVTVGDHVNDLEMIQQYDGYKMLISFPTLYGKGIKSTSSVSSVVKKMIKK